MPSVPERPGQSQNSLSCPLSRTEGALSWKKNSNRPVLVPRLVACSLGTEISAAATLTTPELRTVPVQRSQGGNAIRGWRSFRVFNEVYVYLCSCAVHALISAFLTAPFNQVSLKLHLKTWQLWESLGPLHFSYVGIVQTAINCNSSNRVAAYIHKEV